MSYWFAYLYHCEVTDNAGFTTRLKGLRERKRHENFIEFIFFRIILEHMKFYFLLIPKTGTNVRNYACQFEVLTAVATFLDMTLCNSMKITLRFGWICRLHRQVRIVSQARTSMKQTVELRLTCTELYSVVSKKTEGTLLENVKFVGENLKHGA
jgi:hypothetical protein